MSDDVKAVVPRPEQARTRLARRAVVDAARGLFVEQGYTSTSIGAVSQRSGVPEATIYRLYASKVGILKAILDTSIAGDDQPIAVGERPDVAALREEADPEQALAAFARVTSAINQRTHDIHRVLVSAADSDPAAADLLTELQRQRARGQGEVVRALHRRGALRPGLSNREAADLVHAVMSPELFRLLVVDRGWSPARYERWLAATLAQQLT